MVPWAQGPACPEHAEVTLTTAARLGQRARKQPQGFETNGHYLAGVNAQVCITQVFHRERVRGPEVVTSMMAWGPPAQHCGPSALTR